MMYGLKIYFMIKFQLIYGNQVIHLWVLYPFGYISNQKSLPPDDMWKISDEYWSNCTIGTNPTGSGFTTTHLWFKMNLQIYVLLDFEPTTKLV